MKKPFLQSIILLFSAIFLFSYCQNTTETETTATTEDTTPAVAEQTPLEQGEELYISYCGICHGDDGKGDGAMASQLKIPPSDLTTIRARRDGTFPKEELHEIISGGQQVPGHGEGDMPVWGETFLASEGLSSQEEVDEKIDYLIMYLETIQE